LVIWIICIVFVVGINVNLVFAEDLNLRVNGIVNGYSSDVWLKTNSLGSSSIDAYDIRSQSCPSNCSRFYSDDDVELGIHSWASNPQEISLVYNLPSAQTGNIVFSWDQLTGSHSATLQDYGDDSSYTTLVDSTDLRDGSSYSKVLNGSTNVYMKVLVTDYVAPVTATPSDSSGGGGGGGGGITTSKKINFGVSDEEYSIRIVLDEIRTRKLIVSNPTNESIRVVLSSQGLDEFIIFPKSINIPALSEEEVIIKFISPDDPGVDTGKIILTSGSSRKEILVRLNTQSRETLFDISVDLSESVFDISEGLKAQLSLLPVGEKGVDVTIKYFIKDFSGQIYHESSETFYVDKPVSFVKEFDIDKLNEGDYVLAAEMTYIGGIASASSQFEVKGAGVPTFKLTPQFMVLIGVSVLIIVIILLFSWKNLKKGRKKKKK